MPPRDLSFGLWIILWLSFFVLKILMKKSILKLNASRGRTQKGNAERQESSHTHSTKYHLTMGLRRPIHDRWLIVDDNYLPEHKIKVRLMQNKKSNVIGYTQGGEAACEEVLDLVVKYLTSNYPKSFKHCSRLFVEGSALEFAEGVEIISTGEIFKLTAPFVYKTPLEIAAHLTMEDLNILIKGDDGQHIL